MKALILQSVATAGLMVSGCASKQDLTSVEAAVSEFHMQQIAHHDDMILKASDDAFRSVATLADLTRLNDAVRSAASSCTAPVRDVGNVNIVRSTHGDYVGVTYTRTCANGPLLEAFNFKLQKGVPKLVAYNVSGMALFPTAPRAAPPSSDAPDVKTTAL